MERVRQAIILAGGLGTRMLPASIYSPKEGLPLVDTPIIHHLLWECVQAGVEEAHIVLSKRKKDQWEDFLNGNTIFSEDARLDLHKSALTPLSGELAIIMHVQESPGGVGDAIRVAINSIEGPFLLLLGDNLLLKNHFGPCQSGPENGSDASLKLVKKFHDSGGLPCVGTKEVFGKDISKYGCVGQKGGKVTSVIEKPDFTGKAGMDALCGRYLLPAETKEMLETCTVEEFGEMQSIVLLEQIIRDIGLNVVSLDEYELYDSGDPISWLKSQIDHSLRRPDLRDEISKWISERMKIL